MPFGVNSLSLFVIFLATGLSALPDIDLRFESKYIKHRGKFTHSLFFAIVAGLLFGFLLYSGNRNFMLFLSGFAGGFGGVGCHLIGDSLTYMKFKPFWPFSQREIAFKLCHANDRRVNDGLMGAGTIALILYFLVGAGF
jgi:membrane-bound metal-dependent hydrolase YbcI (DUF457 family)